MEMDYRIEEILYSETELQDKIKELGQWVDDNYPSNDKLILVGILKGCIPFIAHLIVNIKRDLIVDFMTLSSYEGGSKSNSNVKVIMDLAHDIKGKDVLIIEDCVDTGYTMAKIVSLLNNRNPKSLKVLTLLDKKGGRKIPFTVDKFGFDCPQKFVVGYGFDWNDEMRNIPYIGVLKKELI
ncbi:hypoxanthine phosphoribosyltransferase [Mycoplasma phocoenae]|uniref:Hypoxanthine phosphoribosyltransferase n=1 Tax=Mycoplasma phocoenae TaxID=754517 RepID=A0A858U8I1_9MOLU|nr:hypoxanthine phosphoribosyltransferase [Mycoplasma phocoenae]QJG67026.1 hypoxanthine phosphoribosyltransferase [Mycoplasma phocoenae]